MHWFDKLSAIDLLDSTNNIYKIIFHYLMNNTIKKFVCLIVNSENFLREKIKNLHSFRNLRQRKSARL